MTTTAEPNTTTPNYRDTVTQTPTNAWPRFADLWDILLTPGGFTPRPDSPAVAAMLADSYDEHDRLVCLDHKVPGCRPCGLVTP